MITKEQYLEALEIIDQYHFQQNKQQPEKQDEPQLIKTPIKDWVDSFHPKEITTRLENILLGHYRFGNKQNQPPFTYVEDVFYGEFMRQRNAGEKAWGKFCELRKQKNNHEKI
jgi:hypothetical protein